MTVGGCSCEIKPCYNIERWSYMGVHFSLSRTGKFDDNGETFSQELFSISITHNLCRMAIESGLYNIIWRPEENGFNKASDAIQALNDGYQELRDNPIEYRQYNPENGWGSYDSFCESVKSIIHACGMYPNATIEADR